MKYNSLVSCSVAVAIAASATPVHATPVTDYESNQSHGLNVNLYISGSISVDNALNFVIQSDNFNICQTGTVNEYTALNGAYGGSDTMWYCQAGIQSGVSTNLYIAIFKEDTLGSINGVQPLIAVAKGGSSGLSFLNASGADVQAGTCGSGLNDYCTAGDFQTNIAPTGGVSDVEGALLQAEPRGGSLSTSDINKYLGAYPGFDIVWGLGVSKNLYYALQSAEGLTPDCPSGNLDSPTCAPSLSKPQVASILNGQIYSWTQLGLTNPSGDSNVYICRGSVDSGAEASFEAYFLGARCSTSSESMQLQQPPFVVEEENDSYVLSCLMAFDLGGYSITPYNNDYDTTFAPFTPAGHQWALGVLSTELTQSQINIDDNTTDTQNPGTGTTRMVAIDGILPTLENVVNGYYPYWGTSVWYSITQGDDISNSTNRLGYKVFQAIEEDIGSPVSTGTADLNYVNVWGDGGDLSPASIWLTSSPDRSTYSSYPVTASELSEDEPVNQFTKMQSAYVDNCDVPVLYSPATTESAVEARLLGSGNVNQGP